MPVAAWNFRSSSQVCMLCYVGRRTYCREIVRGTWKTEIMFGEKYPNKYEFHRVECVVRARVLRGRTTVSDDFGSGARSARVAAVRRTCRTPNVAANAARINAPNSRTVSHRRDRAPTVATHRLARRAHACCCCCCCCWSELLPTHVRKCSNNPVARPTGTHARAATRIRI